jgi:hypothetical protein
VKAKATKRAMATKMRVVSHDKGNGNGNKGGGQVTAMRTLTAVMTEVGEDEGNGDGDEGGGQQRG